MVRGGTMGPQDDDEDDLSMMLFPVPRREAWLNEIFILCYTQHGCGMAMGWQDVMELDAGDRPRLLDLLGEQRKRDHK